MSKRDVILDALAFRKPAYVPWSIGLTIPAAEKVRKYLGVQDLGPLLDNHFFEVYDAGFSPVRETATHMTDIFGVTWDRTVDKDIGTPCDWPIKTQADLDTYQWPTPGSEESHAAARQMLKHSTGRFTRYGIGFSLFERAWTLHGMSELLMDMVAEPQFVERLMDKIVEYNLVLVHKALELGVDCVHFGDDYGMQAGLIMGRPHWLKFIKPRLARMFAPVRAAGKVVSMHSCGQVNVLFDDLVEIGLNMFNPFQPEVMNVFELIPHYRGTLAFHGGMSTQKTLPFGSVEDVRAMTRRLIQAGSEGGYIFSPAHDTPADVPPQNVVAMVEELKAQPGYKNASS